MQGSMFPFGSTLPSEAFVRHGIFSVVPSRLSWSRNYAAKDIELKKSPKVKDCSVIEESFLTGFMQQVKNPTCEPDEYGDCSYFDKKTF
ncbi:hypothetical protein WN943_023239 [Citrus x changshan-huyou]